MGVEGVQSDGSTHSLNSDEYGRARVEVQRPPEPIKLSSVSNYLTDDVKDQLRGHDYKSFDTLRSAINRAMAESEPSRVKFGFTDRDIAEMRQGRNPWCSEDSRLGQRGKMEYEHTRERRDGFSWGDIDNLRLVSPAAHVRKIIRSFYRAADSA